MLPLTGSVLHRPAPTRSHHDHVDGVVDGVLEDPDERMAAPDGPHGLDPIQRGHIGSVTARTAAIKNRTQRTWPSLCPTIPGSSLLLPDRSLPP